VEAKTRKPYCYLIFSPTSTSRISGYSGDMMPDL
jgi:hypothetical protein